MFIDFNNFFTVRTRNLWRIKEKLLRPPHLYSVIALPSKTNTTANIDAYSKEVAVFNMFLYFTRVFMTARSIILTAYHVLNH